MATQKSYIKEAGDISKIFDDSSSSNIMKKAKLAFKSGNADSAWTLYNQALMASVAGPDIHVGSHFLSRQSLVIRCMVIQLLAEEKYKTALTSLFRQIGLEVLQCAYDSNNPISGIAPRTLDMYDDIIQRGEIDQDFFDKVYDDVTTNISKRMEGIAKAYDKKADLDISTVQNVDWSILKESLRKRVY